MNPEQIRAKLVEISARLEGISASDAGYTEEQITEIGNLNAEFETLNTQLETAEKVEAMKAKASASTGRKTSVAATPQPRIEVGRQLNERFGGFNSSGEFLMAVKRAGQTGDVDKRFQGATAYEKVGEDGGFLIPEEISQAIVKKLAVQESLMSGTTSLQVSGNALSINIDESQPWNQGVQCYWTAEGASITESKPVFKQAHFRLHKIAALVKATDELLEDATALESYIKASAPSAFMHKINGAIISGSGAGKPLGILNSAFAVTVAAEGGQTADTVNAKNVLKMYSRMFPTSRANAAWFINPAVEDQLRQMVDGNNNYIYISPGGQLNQTPYGTLMGRPVVPLMGSMPALGDLGDIIFADMSYYYMINKAGGIKSATSIHLLFDKEQTAFRFSMRVDGKCPFSSPVTTEFGSYDMSAIVLLAAR
jgi:HK97 family phage major capsid protein